MFTSLLNPSALLKSLPSLCAVCLTWQAQRVCPACIARFAPKVQRCLRCAARVPDGMSTCGACLRRPPPFMLAVAAADHHYPWSRLVADLKFHAGLDLVEPLAQRLFAALQGRAGNPVSPDLILPVPLSRARLAERGYNQAWELSRWLARRLGLPAHADWLLRLRDTAHQIDLSLPQRQSNLRGAFAVQPRRLGALRGRQVAIVDDVMTTGATAGELARTLLQAGAAGVQVWVVTRTPLD
ncbi:ComF family protein [Schlegelella sp. S2-27]|uniref:ComF family protein n=1 Tax=Caldimonas mangrovi TaxID=2944811 RepID=A0ABT0YJ68_9BURK|nr:ComF family protein [Caldimonas mangrovi]MCM5678758.1 ComF family protein [Caldimonas mangrovi]